MMRKLARPRALILLALISLLTGFFVTSHLAGASRAPAAATAQSRSINYTYDAAGRLTQVDYGNGTRITYTYDNAGNLLRREVVASR
jgi:YD repeat-containing protein